VTRDVRSNRDRLFHPGNQDRIDVWVAGTWAVRLGLGHIRDVSMIEGEAEVLGIDALPQERGDRFAARTGFGPRALAAPYRWFRISPRRIQA